MPYLSEPQTFVVWFPGKSGSVSKILEGLELRDSYHEQPGSGAG